MINVVAGIIFNKEGKIYICKRPPDKSLGGFWEFPGGKVESGELYEEALKRELEEELSAKIEVVSKFDEYIYDYDTFSINLISFICSLKSLQCHSKEHIDEVFLSVEELQKYKMAPADIQLISKLTMEINE